MTDKVIAIGFTKKPHGLKGEIKLQVEDRYVEDILSVDVLLVAIKGKPTPFFVEDLRIGNHIIAKFEDVNTPEEATAIASKALYMREEDLLLDIEREMPIDTLEYEHCVGYALYDKGVFIATIDDVAEFPQQEMAIISYKNQETLVPLNTVFIVSIDDAAKRIDMDLPDGMLDLSAAEGA